ncbi:MAG: hypothetical protein ACI9DS_002542 [Glaciecola sp.]|jgi:hypothetical protein
MSSIFKSSVALPISIALLLSACGGGGSSSTNDGGGSSSTPATVSLSANSMTVMVKNLRQSHGQVLTQYLAQRLVLGLAIRHCLAVNPLP